MEGRWGKKNKNIQPPKKDVRKRKKKERQCNSKPLIRPRRIKFKKEDKRKHPKKIKQRLDISLGLAF